MRTAHRQTIKELLDEAIAHGAAERSCFLNRARSGDSDLQGKVSDRLLARLSSSAPEWQSISSGSSS